MGFLGCQRKSDTSKLTPVFLILRHSGHTVPILFDRVSFGVDWVFPTVIVLIDTSLDLNKLEIFPTQTPKENRQWKLRLSP